MIKIMGRSLPTATLVIVKHAVFNLFYNIEIMFDFIIYKSQKKIYIFTFKSFKCESGLETLDNLDFLEICLLC